MREVPNANLFDTPLTNDPYQDGSGMAHKTIKARRDAGNLAGAKEYGEQWLEINGKHWQVLNTLITVYLASAQSENPDPNDLKRAVEIGRAGLELTNKEIAIAEHLAKALVMQGKTDDAIQALKGALAKNPKDWKIKNLLIQLQNPPRPRGRR